jgi:hypothetical protein
MAHADLDLSQWLRWTTPANTLYYTKIMDIAGVGSATFLINAVSDACILLWDDGQVWRHWWRPLVLTRGTERPGLRCGNEGVITYSSSNKE